MKNDNIIDIDNHSDLIFPSNPDSDTDCQWDVLKGNPADRAALIPFLGNHYHDILNRKRCKQPL